MIEVSTADYGGNSAAPTISTGGCCIANCDGDPWERIDANPCNVSLVITSTMEPPSYLYYKLTNYYQNHRRYVRSRDDEQLQGDTSVGTGDLSSTCSYHYQTDSGDVINPCGLIAWSLFNDSYRLFQPDGTEVALQTSNIAWESDLKTKFHNSRVQPLTGDNFPPFAFWRALSCSDDPRVSGNQTFTPAEIESKRADCVQYNTEFPGIGWCFPGSGFCTEDEHFVVWMRSAGLPTFRKLFAKITQRLEPGEYRVQISSGINTFIDDDGAIEYDTSTYYNYGYPPANATSNVTAVEQQFLYPVGSFDGTKQVVLSTVSWIGGKNFFLGYAYLVVGIVCIVLAICFFIKSRVSPRDLGNATYVSWNKDAPPK